MQVKFAGPGIIRRRGGFSAAPENCPGRLSRAGNRRTSPRLSVSVLPLVLLLLVVFSPASRATTVSDGGDDRSFHLVTLEFLTLGMSWAMSRNPNDNADTYAAIFASAGSFSIATPLIFGTEAAPPQTMVPMGLGYLGMAWYHHRHAQTHSERRVFRNNVIGLHLMYGIVALSGHWFGGQPAAAGDRLSWLLAPAYLGVRFRF